MDFGREALKSRRWIKHTLLGDQSHIFTGQKDYFLIRVSYRICELVRGKKSLWKTDSNRYALPSDRILFKEL